MHGAGQEGNLTKLLSLLVLCAEQAELERLRKDLAGAALGEGISENK